MCEQHPPERERALREALTWISDPSYVGNYAPLEVIEIHRKWAKKALAAQQPPEQGEHGYAEHLREAREVDHQERKHRARPDYDPRLDHPERYTDGPV